MTFGSIYKIQFPNGKYYIGLTTTSLEQRRQEHKYRAKKGNTRILYNALRKYVMVDTFELIEIDTTDSLEELCEIEIRYIKEYNSYYMNGKGYNMTHGGEGINGYVFTEEDKQRASEKTKKQFENPETRELMSKIKKKYYQNNPESIQHMRETTKKYYETNPEARQQASETIKKYYETHPEARQQASETKKTYYETHPEAGKEHGEKIKKYYQYNPEAREMLSKIKKKYFENPETRENMSKTKIKYYEDNLDARKKLSDGKGNNIPFDILTIDGTFIKTFSYQFEAREYLQKEYDITSFIKISQVLSGSRHSSAGFVFKYK
jgi:hypothetical protein